MSAQPIRYTVIGAGHGGKAMAAHLALMGFGVLAQPPSAECGEQCLSVQFYPFAP